MIKSKIKSQKEIVGIAKALKRKNEKIVTYNGSFDILHLGHIKSLEEAKKQGDVLIVPLNSDKSVKSYKGPNRPIVPENERAQTLAALECVDYVVIFDEINPKGILGKIKPDIHCHGSDWGRDCVEKEVVEKNGGRIHILKTVPGLSTSGLIKKILNVYSKPEIRAVFLDRDGTVNVNEPEYVHRIEDFKFAPHALSALRELSKTDYRIIIATNQSGIGKGYFSEKDVQNLHQWLKGELKKKGIRVDEIYYCPHRPNDNCACRKPKPGLLIKAAEDFGINLSKSWFIGDREVDVLCGKEGNLKTIMIKSKGFKRLALKPDYYVKDLLAAVKIVLT